MNDSASSFELSLITVCYNSKPTIERTIHSVLEQKTANIEYIIIDGGSIDGTQEIVHSFGDKIDVFISEPDRGISDGFNKGIALAKGKIIALVNSDDTLLPGTVQRVLDYFQRHPDCQVLHGDLLLYNGDILVKRLVPAGRWWYPWRLVLFNHPATFVKKSVYDTFGLFSLNYRIAMDVEIFLRWFKAGVRINYLPEALVAMYYGGVSNSRPYDGYREAQCAFIQHGYPLVVVYLLYVAKCLLHHIGCIHASLLVFLKSR